MSAFGARLLNEGSYRGKLVVNWLAGNNPSRASARRGGSGPHSAVSMYGVFPLEYEKQVGLTMEFDFCVCVCDIWATCHSLALVTAPTKQMFLPPTSFLSL